MIIFTGCIPYQKAVLENKSMPGGLTAICPPSPCPQWARGMLRSGMRSLERFYLLLSLAGIEKGNSHDFPFLISHYDIVIGQIGIIGMAGLLEVDIKDISQIIVINPDLLFWVYLEDEGPMTQFSLCCLFLPRPYLCSPLQLPFPTAQKSGDHKTIRFAYFLVDCY